MPFFLLLAMQAAGMVVDYLGTKNQSELMDMGAKIQQAGIEANVMQTRLETADASLQAMRKLRQNLGTQLAVQSARGTKSGAGSAFSLLNESIGNFDADERMRRLNGLGKENQLRAGAAISRLKNNSDTSKLWQGFASRTINRFPSSVSGWQQYANQASQGFGLTSIGGNS